MKTHFNINPIIHNFLDRSFQNILLPFRCLQHMLFLSRFSIEYNCIRPHRVSYYIVSLIGTLGFIIFHMQNLIAKEFEGVTNDFLVVFIKLNVLFLVFPFITFYILNIIQRKDHVHVILKIQKVFRLINFKDYKKSTKGNWYGVLRHFIFFMVGVLLTQNLKLAIYFYSSIYVDVHLTYGVSIISLMREGIITWISEVEYYSTLSLELEEEKFDDKLKKLFQAYYTLMDAFDIFKKLFMFSALYQALNTFLLSLLYLQTIIELSKSGVTYYGMYDVDTFVIVTILWVLKNVIFVSVFSRICEKFYGSVYEADSACSRLLRSLQSSVEAKKLCKNVQRLNRAAFHKMTACRMFTIDGRLPHTFNSLVAEYTAVISQFAILSWKRYKAWP